MKVEFEPVLGCTLGAVVHGSRISEYTSIEVGEIKRGFLEYAVLIWQGQHLNAKEQMAFASNFGDLVIDYLPFSNVDENGDLRPADDPLMRLFKGNEGWHTDSSFQMLAAKASLLSAIKVPTDGGETEWADLRAAYNELDQLMKDRIAELNAYHSLYRSQEKLGDGDRTTQEGLAILHENDAKAPPSKHLGRKTGYSQSGEAPLRPLVKIHPETYRPALYIGRHAYAIEGMADERAHQLLEDLMSHTCRKPRVLTHQWQVGDLVMWDNRCVLHRARPWPVSQARVMHHTRVNGEIDSESALNSRRTQTV